MGAVLIMEMLYIGIRLGDNYIMLSVLVLLHPYNPLCIPCMMFIKNNTYFSSYYIVVVFIVPLQGLYVIL